MITLIGDSIRMGYEATVRAALDGVAEVWSPEANGGDSGNVLAHLDEWVAARGPELVHLNCGLHDIKKPFDTGRPQVGLDAYRRNLEEIFARIASAGARLVWATTTPVDEDRHHRTKGFDRFAADVAAYNHVARQVAADAGVPVNDLFAVAAAAGADRLLGDDGVHFTDEGSRLLGEAVAGFLRPLLSHP